MRNLPVSINQKDLAAFARKWGVREVSLFGSILRDDFGPDSDVDVLVILREGERETKKEVRRLGHDLAVLSEAVPSIMVYTKAEWVERGQNGSPFYRAVMRDGVQVS